MYNPIELSYEALIELAKQSTKGVPMENLLVDKIAYDYNVAQYNNCIRGIQDENYQIANIFNRISQRGGYATQYDLAEMSEHMRKRQEYEAKFAKHMYSSAQNAGEIMEHCEHWK